MLGQQQAGEASACDSRTVHPAISSSAKTAAAVRREFILIVSAEMLCALSG
jgi:hypothetical protein